jgi:hypothetical protein
MALQNGTSVKNAKVIGGNDLQRYTGVAGVTRTSFGRLILTLANILRRKKDVRFS